MIINGYLNSFARYGINSYIIPNDVKIIGEGAFEDCDNLTSVTIPNSVTTIASRAFFECENLKDISLPENITEIGSSAFDSCDSFSEFTFPKSIIKIGGAIFAYCDNLKTVIFKSITPPQIDEHIFLDSNIKSIRVPAASLDEYKNAIPGYSNCIEGYYF